MSSIFVETEDQRAILETVRRFNEAVVAPVAVAATGAVPKRAGAV